MSKSSAAIHDTSAKLTNRLVAAKAHMEILDITSSANKELSQLLIIAAGGGEDAQKANACIKKLEKLIVRCNQKRVVS